MFRFFIIVLSIISVGRLAEAKRDFFVEKDVRCGVGGVCYLAADSTPFNGKHRTYYPNGVVKADVEYQNGAKNGVASHYFPDGRQRLFQVFRNGVLHGGMSSYYNSGNVEAETSYTDGVMNGPNKGFYENGTLKLENTYVNGVRHGRERSFSEDGKAVNDVMFDMGKPVTAICRTNDGRTINYSQEAEDYIRRNKTPCDE